MMASIYPIRNACQSVSLTKTGGKGQGNEAKEGTPLSQHGHRQEQQWATAVTI